MIGEGTDGGNKISHRRDFQYGEICCHKKWRGHGISTKYKENGQRHNISYVPINITLHRTSRARENRVYEENFQEFVDYKNRAMCIIKRESRDNREGRDGDV